MNKENTKRKIMRKRRMKRKIKKFTVKSIRFIFKYIIPLLLLTIAICISIFAPMKFYYNGTIYNIKMALVTVIPIMLVLVTIALIIIKRWIDFLRYNEVIR